MFDLWRWQELWRDRSDFLQGWATTVEASVLALLLALAIGVVVGVLAVAPWKPTRWLTNAYVQFFQNTPLVVQVFFLYYGLPHLGVMIPTFAVGVLGLSFYTGAYISEVIRAGILSIHRGQMEAAYSQGMTYMQAMRHIILPQAWRVILPPLTNQFVNLIKNSSVLSLIAGGELIYHADSWASVTFSNGVAYLTISVMYLILTLPLATWTRRLERRMARGQGVAVP